MSKRLVLWGYVVEIAASGAILLCLCLWLGTDSVVSFLREAAIDIATLFGAVMLAASLAFLWSFYTKADTDFYRWLEGRGAFVVYLRATGYAVAVSLASTGTLVVLKYINNTYLGLLATYLLLLAMFNLYTLVANVMGLMRLNAMYNHAKHDT